MRMMKPSYSWWFDSHNSPRHSPWLTSILAELDEKMKAMLKLIEEDADSFAQRAEMYYKKRPELVNMVEDFYRAHRSLAERYDQLKLDVGTRHSTPLGSPRAVRNWLQKPTHPTEKSSRASSVSLDTEESEVDDPQQEETEVNSNSSELSDKESGCGVAKPMNEEIERLKAENLSLKAQLQEKDEEKREAIRQLCLSLDILKEDNVDLRKYIKDSKKRGLYDLKKLTKGVFAGKLFGGHSKVQPTTIVAI